MDTTWDFFCIFVAYIYYICVYRFVYPRGNFQNTPPLYTTEYQQHTTIQLTNPTRYGN